jgi:creatinine amidohydrolase/Fe(II)-dependent formamide hydrolase-like protein
MDKASKVIPAGQTDFIHFDMQKGGPVSFLEPMSRLTETGVIGDATLGTAEKGKVIVEKSAERLAEFIREFRRRVMKPSVDHH